MHRTFRFTASALALAICAALGAGTALADKPAGKGKDKDRGQNEQRSNGHEQSDRGGSVSVRFDARQQTLVREYYGKEFKAGHCPPGLAKKNNGCMPPGQAKKWKRGAPLPRDVVFYELPPKLEVQIGLPPAGHRFVRVANDILLIATGTSMVVDAIQDLGNL